MFQDNKYLQPYIEEVARERREKEEWNKNWTLVKTVYSYN
jgi:hypothetical protein